MIGENVDDVGCMEEDLIVENFPAEDVIVALVCDHIASRCTRCDIDPSATVGYVVLECGVTGETKVTSISSKGRFHAPRHLDGHGIDCGLHIGVDLYIEVSEKVIFELKGVDAEEILVEKTIEDVSVACDEFSGVVLDSG